MAGMNGLEPDQAGWFKRIVYGIVRRKVGKRTGNARLIEPVKIAAHHTRLLRAFGQMEMGQEAARSIPAALKSLVDIKAAMLIGCPF